ncbi:hypothetical protein [Nitrospira sp. M1]
MKIGSPIPPWRVPTYIKGTLTFSSLSHFSTHPLVLCCAPSLTAPQAWLLESHIKDFHMRQVFLATLVSRYMDYDVPWTLPSSNFRLPLLTDPLNRLGRSLGLSRHLPANRCETLFFNQCHRLEFRLLHDLTAKGISRVLEITEHHFPHLLLFQTPESMPEEQHVQPALQDVATLATAHVPT